MRLTAVQEGKNGVIHLQAIDKTKEEQDYSCDDPEAVRLMVDYIYLDDYAFGATASTPDTISDTAEGFSQPFSPSVKYTMSPSFGNWPHSSGFTSNKKSKRLDKDSPDGALVMHARLYGMAAKYGVDSLRPVAIRKFEEAVSGTWSLDDFAAAVSTTFNTTEPSDLGLRNVIIDTLVSSSLVLAADPVIEKAVTAIEGLSFELFKQLSLKQTAQSR